MKINNRTSGAAQVSSRLPTNQPTNRTSMSQGRSVWGMIWQNFKKSLKLLPPKGKFVGEDNLGNKYFEAIKGYYVCKHFPLIIQISSFKPVI